MSVPRAAAPSKPGFFARLFGTGKSAPNAGANAAGANAKEAPPVARPEPRATRATRTTRVDDDEPTRLATPPRRTTRVVDHAVERGGEGEAHRYTYPNGQRGFMNIDEKGRVTAGVDGNATVRGQVGDRLDGDARGLLARSATASAGGVTVTTRLLDHDVPSRLTVGTKFYARYETNGAIATYRYTVQSRDPRTGHLTIVRTADGQPFVSTIVYDVDHAKIMGSRLGY